MLCKQFSFEYQDPPHGFSLLLFLRLHSITHHGPVNMTDRSCMSLWVCSIKERFVGVC